MSGKVSSIEQKYNVQAVSLSFILVFFLWFLVFYLVFPVDWSYLNNLLMLLISSLIMGIFFGAMTLIFTYRKTIKKSFTNKEDFLNNIDSMLFQIGFKKDYNSKNFFSYKPSFKAGVASGNINITINEKEATITGSRLHIKKIEKNFN